MCLGATHWSGVGRLVCGATKADAQALGFDEGPVNDSSYAHLRDRGVEVVRGVLRDEAVAVLKRYQDLGRPVY
jgi:tRNA(Arg) A34 adenosine deaminase TadA